MKDAKWFTNQVALVTGASGGLGAQIAIELAKRDVQLILVARNMTKLEQVAAECHRSLQNLSIFIRVI